MMQSGGNPSNQNVFLILLRFGRDLRRLARKFANSLSHVLVVAGLLSVFIPGIPKISLNPDVSPRRAPPLLYSAAWLTSGAISKSICQHLLLAFGLVASSASVWPGNRRWVCTALIGGIGFDWAPSSRHRCIARHFHRQTRGLPQRIAIPECRKPWVNDATGLWAPNSPVLPGSSMAATHTVAQGALRLTYLIAAGSHRLSVGLVVRNGLSAA